MATFYQSLHVIQVPVIVSCTDLYFDAALLLHYKIHEVQIYFNDPSQLNAMHALEYQCKNCTLQFSEVVATGFTILKRAPY